MKIKNLTSKALIREIIAWMFLLSFNMATTPALASDSALHHFDIDVPKASTIGEDTKVTITARGTEGTKIKNKTYELLVQFQTTMSKPKEMELTLVDGQTEIDVPVNTRYTIIQVSDKNSDVMNSEIINAKYPTIQKTTTEK